MCYKHLPTTRIAGGLLFRTSPFLRLEKLRCTQQAKAHNKRSITRCFLCINLYAQQIKIRPSLSTDSCTLLAGKSTVFSTSPITIATVHEIHLQLVFSVVIVALYHLFCKLFSYFSIAFLYANIDLLYSTNSSKDTVLY